MDKKVTLKAEIISQQNNIRNILTEEMKRDSYQTIEDGQGNELSVEEIVELQFFQEDDLVETFVADNEEYSLEELRDMQHDAIANLSDIIEENQIFRDKLKKH
jgi:hypothetical protein